MLPRLITAGLRICQTGLITRLCNPLQTSVRTLANEAPIEQPSSEFDKRMLDYLVCPLSKTPLRYNAETNELICDELQVAYAIVNGIPNLLPQEARRMSEDKATPLDS